MRLSLSAAHQSLIAHFAAGGNWINAQQPVPAVEQLRDEGISAGTVLDDGRVKWTGATAAWVTVILALVEATTQTLGALLITRKLCRLA